jgi:hypothetical protein
MKKLSSALIALAFLGGGTFFSSREALAAEGDLIWSRNVAYESSPSLPSLGTASVYEGTSTWGPLLAQWQTANTYTKMSGADGAIQGSVSTAGADFDITGSINDTDGTSVYYYGRTPFAYGSGTCNTYVEKRNSSDNSLIWRHTSSVDTYIDYWGCATYLGKQAAVDVTGVYVIVDSGLGDASVFLKKISKSGMLLWSRQLFGVGTDLGAWAHFAGALVADSSGVYVSYSKLDWLGMSSGADYLAKYNQAGALVWWLPGSVNSPFTATNDMAVSLDGSTLYTGQNVMGSDVGSSKSTIVYRNASSGAVKLTADIPQKFIDGMGANSQALYFTLKEPYAFSDQSTVEKRDLGLPWSVLLSRNITGSIFSVKEDAFYTRTYPIFPLTPGVTTIQKRGIPPLVNVDLKINASDGPLAVPTGSNMNLTWASTGAATCAITGGAGWAHTPPLPLSSAAPDVVAATGASTYTLSCTNAWGMAASDSVVVTIANSLKVCEGSCSSGVAPLGTSVTGATRIAFPMIQGTTRNLKACWNTAPDCSLFAGDVTGATVWSETLADTVQFQALNVTTQKPLFAGAAGSEDIAATYGGVSALMTANVICVPTEICATYSDRSRYCPDQAFSFVDSCGVVQNCSGGNRYCEFNVKEVEQ